MEAYLKFSLPEDKHEFDVMSTSMDVACACWDFDQWLRSMVKYRSDDISEPQLAVYEEVRQQFHDYFDERGLNLDDLIQ